MFSSSDGVANSTAANQLQAYYMDHTRLIKIKIKRRNTGASCPHSDMTHMTP